MLDLYRLDKKSLLDHIEDLDDMQTMRRVLDKILMVLKNFNIESTDFLTPYERELSKSILNRFDDINYKFIGGNEFAERKVIIIYPSYHYFVKDDIDISSLRLKGSFDNLTHRDFLGGVLSLGIDRDKIGDIYIGRESADIIIKNEIKNFVFYNLERIGKSKISLKEIPLEEINYTEDSYEEIIRTMSSNRLDVYLSTSYNLSRRSSQSLIKSGMVQVNWKSINKSSFEVNAGDLISTRGYGRSKLYSIDGLSKKNRLKVTIRKLV